MKIVGKPYLCAIFCVVGDVHCGGSGDLMLCIETGSIDALLEDTSALLDSPVGRARWLLKVLRHPELIVLVFIYSAAVEGRLVACVVQILHEGSHVGEGDAKLVCTRSPHN